MFSDDDRLALYRAGLASNPQVFGVSIEEKAHEMLARERSAASVEVPTVEWYHLPGAVATCRIATKAIVVRGCVYPQGEAYSYHVALDAGGAAIGTTSTRSEACDALESALRERLATLTTAGEKKA